MLCSPDPQSFRGIEHAETSGYVYKKFKNWLQQGGESWIGITILTNWTDMKSWIQTEETAAERLIDNFTNEKLGSFETGVICDQHFEWIQYNVLICVTSDSQSIFKIFGVLKENAFINR